jgi:hypothetical protein
MYNLHYIRPIRCANQRLFQVFRVDKKSSQEEAWNDNKDDPFGG